MAVTQYIGSRYVPLFAEPIEWSSQNTYEPLTIVIHEGNSYTSRQAVPKGIAIDNEDFWALTGNYNAQVELYRRETAEAKDTADAAQADIDTLLPKSAFSSDVTVKDLIDDVQADVDDVQADVDAAQADIDTLLPKSAFSSDATVKDLIDANGATLHGYLLRGNGSMTLLQAHGKNIIIDVGDATDGARIGSFLESHNVTHIDVVVITHYHADHAGGFASVLNYIDATTSVFIPMRLTNTADPDYAAVTQMETQIANLCASKDVVPVIPSDASTITLADVVNVTFYNTNPANELVYRNSYKETPIPTTEQIPSYNNYSIITRVEVNGFSYVDCADVEVAAQRAYGSAMRKCNVCKPPHHGSANRMGYALFYANLAPDLYVVNQTDYTIGSEPTNYDMNVWQCGYLYRFVDQLMNANCYLNFKIEVSFEIDAGGSKAAGYIITPDGANEVSLVRTFRGVFPPAVLSFDNPNQAAFAGLATYSDWAGYIKDKQFEVNAASGFLQYCAITEELQTVFGMSTLSGFFRCAFENGALTIDRPNSTGRFTKAIIYSTFVAADWPNTGGRLIDLPTTRTPIEYTFANPIGRDLNTTLESLGMSANFYANDILIVVTTNNVEIPMLRVNHNSFMGQISSTGENPTWYVCNITNGRVFNCMSFAMDGSGATQRQIAKVRNPYTYRG